MGTTIIGNTHIWRIWANYNRVFHFIGLAIVRVFQGFAKLSFLKSICLSLMIVLAGWLIFGSTGWHLFLALCCLPDVVGPGVWS